MLWNASSIAALNAPKTSPMVSLRNTRRIYRAEGQTSQRLEPDVTVETSPQKNIMWLFQQFRPRPPQPAETNISCPTPNCPLLHCDSISILSPSRNFPLPSCIRCYDTSGKPQRTEMRRNQCLRNPDLFVKSLTLACEQSSPSLKSAPKASWQRS